MKKVVLIAVLVVIIVIVIVLARKPSKGAGDAETAAEVMTTAAGTDLGQTTAFEDIARSANEAQDPESWSRLQAQLMKVSMADRGKVMSVKDSPDGGLVLTVDVDQAGVRLLADVTLEVPQAKMPAQRPTVGQEVSFSGRIADVQIRPTLRVTVQDASVKAAE